MGLPSRRNRPGVIKKHGESTVTGRSRIEAIALGKRSSFYVRERGTICPLQGFFCRSLLHPLETNMRGILLWAVGVPIPVIILIYLFGGL
jgi:hypothetical protein